jgi:hypothetical protein
MRKRQVWVEPQFAEAKAWHGLGRFRLRGLEKINGEALLIAAGQNLKRLLSRRGWGGAPSRAEPLGSRFRLCDYCQRQPTDTVLVPNLQGRPHSTALGVPFFNGLDPL